jgi:serine protease inhibitor
MKTVDTRVKRMQQESSQRNKFIQRRYGVRLGRRYALAAASVVLMGVIGCSPLNSKSSAVAAPGLRTELPITKPVNPDAKLVSSNTKFGFKLFSEVVKKDEGANIFVSPSSIAFALAMTYNGAEGTTQQAMAKALEYSGLSLQQINSSNAALKSLLENPDPKVQLTVANSLWANSNASLNPSFMRSMRDFYSSRVTNLDFTKSGAADKINDWVKDSTRGKIDKIVEQISPDQVMFLINAIYFKGAWTEPFDKSQTKEHPFKQASGQEKLTPMMSQRGKYKYLETDKFQAISLPYGKDGKVSFYVFLPKDDSGNLKDFYQTLTAENWEKWMSQFRKREGEIRLPRFKMDYEVTLNDALTALGMGEAFSDKANFSGIGKNLAISTVKHKTFVEVSEEGTEAAAATSVGIVALSAPAELPFSMIVDRPFFTCIRDNQTGSILFMGSIAAPQS